MKPEIELMREMRAAGIRPDDAALAADIAVRKLRAIRDRLICTARGLGHSMRQIGDMVGVDVAIVHRVLTRHVPSQQTKAPASNTASSRE